MSPDQWFRLLAFLILAVGLVVACWFDEQHAVPYRDVEED